MANIFRNNNNIKVLINEEDIDINYDSNNIQFYLPKNEKMIGLEQLSFRDKKVENIMIYVG
jgi:hypothetical protein